jgi:ribulose bisphosphate carboxylase small subunit
MEIRTDYSVAEFGCKFVDYRCVLYFRNNLNPKLTYTEEWGTGDTMSLADYIINSGFRIGSKFNDRHDKYWEDLT